MAIMLTETAARHVAGHLQRRGKGLGLRLGVRTSGCSGFAYQLDFVDEVDAADLAFESHGVKVFVAPKDLPMVDGTEVDFAREGLNESFRFSNPNVSAECGCGESFAI
ncbi:MAG: iron-sulfur cluster assembly protein IscA [Burkholderiaceae bacterium]